MMKRIAAIAVLPLIAGCLAAAPKSPTNWVVDVYTSDIVVSTVDVAAPYDGQRFVVLRADGSVAFDGFNSFASRPAALLRSTLRYNNRAPTLFVRRLALDCTKEGERKALVELVMEKSDKSVALVSASSDTADGNYTRAFSAAFSEALAKLKAELAK